MKHYKLLILLIGFGLFFSSCKKEDENKEEEAATQLNNGEIVNEPAPAQFTKKVLIEEFTGEWCGYCPDGAARLQSIKQTFPDKVSVISYHDSDPFSNSTCTLYENLLNVPFFPSAAIDRVPYNGDLSFSRSYWANVTNDRLNLTTNMGLKLETAISGNNLSVDVKFSATADINNLYLTVALIEDEVPESSPGAQAGAPAGYIHHDVFRKMISGNRGDLVNTLANKVIKVSYDNIDISAYNPSTLYVVAFLHEKVDTPNKEVYNVQNCLAGDTQDFD